MINNLGQSNRLGNIYRRPGKQKDIFRILYFEPICHNDVMKRHGVVIVPVPVQTLLRPFGGMFEYKPNRTTLWPRLQAINSPAFAAVACHVVASDRIDSSFCQVKTHGETAELRSFQ